MYHPQLKGGCPHSSQAMFVGAPSQTSVSSSLCSLPLMVLLCLEQVWEPRSWQEYCGIAFRLRSRQASPPWVVYFNLQAVPLKQTTMKIQQWNEKHCQDVLEKGRAITRDDGRTESALLRCPHSIYPLCSNQTQGRVSGGDTQNVLWLYLREWGYLRYKIILKQQSGRPECCGCAWESDES